ncbi:hypothetical protein H6P81_011296 [Aristolochia fimbriata]|uniref:Uncharacterized protein n=1 Tax=Aristolochia fimbriata TaxID=158543 RepID=A0AAV7EU10_ARIFI|nr:hypothetical protein H6P81_011296 [Aristolochia fimbriata]
MLLLAHVQFNIVNLSSLFINSFGVGYTGPNHEKLRQFQFLKKVDIAATNAFVINHQRADAKTLRPPVTLVASVANAPRAAVIAHQSANA